MGKKIGQKNWTKNRTRNRRRNWPKRSDKNSDTKWDTKLDKKVGQKIGQKFWQEIQENKNRTKNWTKLDKKILRARSIKALSDNFHNYYALLTLTTNKIVMIHLTSTQMVVRMRNVLAIPRSKPRSWYVCFSADNWHCYSAKALAFIG